MQHLKPKLEKVLQLNTGFPVFRFLILGYLLHLNLRSIKYMKIRIVTNTKHLGQSNHFGVRSPEFMIKFMIDCSEKL